MSELHSLNYADLIAVGCSHDWETIGFECQCQDQCWCVMPTEPQLETLDLTHLVYAFYTQSPEQLQLRQQIATIASKTLHSDVTDMEPIIERGYYSWEVSWVIDEHSQTDVSVQQMMKLLQGTVSELQATLQSLTSQNLIQ